MCEQTLKLTQQLNEIDERRYQTERLEQNVLSEEEYLWRILESEAQQVGASNEQWKEDTHLAYLFADQEELLRLEQRNRHEFMENWSEDVRKYKQQLSVQESDLQDQLYKERQLQKKERENSGITDKTS